MRVVGLLYFTNEEHHPCSLAARWRGRCVWGFVMGFRDDDGSFARRSYPLVAVSVLFQQVSIR